MPLLRTLPNGKSQIIKDEAFCELLGGNLPGVDIPYTAIFNQFDAEIRNQDSRINTGALSNSHGDWYEWLLALNAWNHFSTNDSANLCILLPNVSRLDVSQLYVSDLCGIIQDLKQKISVNGEVELISSNPDFVIISRSLALEVVPEPEVITDITTGNLNLLQSYYEQFIGRCGFEDILGYVSVKTSFRPDRRLQIPHEGSLMKALYVHLQTRKWIINPPGLRYYALATEVGIPDRDALRTVATHSITTVHSEPQAAVDGVFQVNSTAQAISAFYEILH